MCWRKLLRTKASVFILFVCIFAAPGVLPGCGKSKPPSGYLARVNDNYLTEQEIRNHLDTGFISPQAKIEFSQTWVKNRLLFREAEKAGILNDENFKQILEQNKVELAASYFLNRLVEKQNFTCTEQEKEAYYNAHQQELQLSDDAFFYSAAYFRTQDAAQDFRNRALRSGWNNALVQVRQANALAMAEQDVFAPASGMYSAMQTRLLALMAEEEISQAFSDDNAVFWVVKAGKSFKTGEIPPLFAVHGIVETRILEKKKKDYIDGYIQGLYSSNTIEINPQ